MCISNTLYVCMYVLIPWCRGRGRRIPPHSGSGSGHRGPPHRTGPGPSADHSGSGLLNGSGTWPPHSPPVPEVVVGVEELSTPVIFFCTLWRRYQTYWGEWLIPYVTPLGIWRHCDRRYSGILVLIMVIRMQSIISKRKGGLANVSSKLCTRIEITTTR